MLSDVTVDEVGSNPLVLKLSSAIFGEVVEEGAFFVPSSKDISLFAEEVTPVVGLVTLRGVVMGVVDIND